MGTYRTQQSGIHCGVEVALLGVQIPVGEVRDRLGRPYPVGGPGRVRPELLG
ncbi:MAG: hypothetical protein K2X82_00835 [Gemmataceae bacterium]|nr:hypothetical protein [Gemmataceae bacterium]